MPRRHEARRRTVVRAPADRVRPTPLGAAAVELARGLLSEIETAEEKIEAAVSGRGGYDPSMTAAPHGRRRPERLMESGRRHPSQLAAQ